MDYERKYKDALQRAKHALDCDRNNLVSTDVPLIYSMFPELKESEDERIKQEVIKLVHFFYGSSLACEHLVSEDSMIAWLEKQGESYTKRDVDDAWLKGMCDAKRELEKQSEQKPFDYENANIKQKDWAEIPFGAKDSELQEVSYHIPEGFHAEIYDNRVVIKKGEQNPTWTKEDEERLQSCLSILQTKGIMGVYETINTKWLKSLKERYTWKPSDEQMADLWNMLCECRPADHQLLQDIYYGLKKLREE